jgi:hypothetical protein
MDLISWAPIIGSFGSIVAVVTFWYARAKAEAEALSKATAATTAAATAMAKADLVSTQLAEARIETAREYVSRKDFSESLEGLRSELRGMNDRLDRIIEKVTVPYRGAA